MQTARMPSCFQRTIRSPVAISGIGLHGGMPSRLLLRPAPADTGVLIEKDGVVTPVRWDHVCDTRLNTSIGSAGGGPVVRTVEHMMSAIHGLGIDNLYIVLVGDEIPVLDGSAQPFVESLLNAGLQDLPASRRMIEIIEPVEVRDGEASARLEPFAGHRFSCEIDFDSAAIGHQFMSFDLSPDQFLRDIASARTFGREEDVARLRDAGLARGGSLENAVVIGRTGAVLNPDGLRYGNEFVRHKILDAIGDLALAGLPIQGHFIGVRSGHALNNCLLHALFSSKAAWRIRQDVGCPDLEKVPA